MEESFGSRLKHAWNVFLNREPTEVQYQNVGVSSYIRPDRPMLTRGNDRSIITSIYNRIAIDAAAITLQHVRLDENERFVEVVDSELNNCLLVEANLDQTGRQLKQDIVMSMLDEGCVAVVPVDTKTSPWKSDSFKIETMRVGKIVQWYPSYVKVRLYNERTGQKEEVIVPKRTTAIIENPLYAVMNEPNSTASRLARKLALLDAVDDQNSSGKLNMIIQLPYIIKTDARRKQAEERRTDIEQQLGESKYGIAYTDGTEKITQLSRPLENSLLQEVDRLTSMLYGQLGMTEAVMNGTADEKEMLNYYNRTIEPILSAIADEMKRKFLSKTARTQHQSILFFRDPFKLVPVADLANVADTFTRNEIMTSNEFRQVIGMKPSNNPQADELSNKNMPVQDRGSTADEAMDSTGDPEANLDQLDAQIDELEGMLQADFDEEFMAHQYASPYYDPVKAHEYYMKNRKLKSTAGLNDEGKEAASYIKKNLNDERDQQIEAVKKASSEAIKSNNTKLRTDLDRNSAAVKSQISSNRDTMNSQISSNRDAMNSTIDSNRETLNNTVKKNNEKLKQELERHSTHTQGKIDDLRSKLSSMSKAEKAEHRDEINAEIAKLRNDNNAEKVKLREANTSTNTNLRNENSAKTKSLRSENSQKSSELRAANSSESSRLRAENSAKAATLREGTKSANDAIREVQKQTIKSLRSTYDEAYGNEVEKLLNEVSFQKKKK